MTTAKLTVALELTLLAYHQTTTLVDLFPFNGARFSKPGERFAEAALNGVLMLGPPMGFALGWRPLMQFGAAYYVILFACEVATWFVPYLLGASSKWEATYRRVHASTIMLLPRRGANPTPNLEHLILMAFTLATAASTLVSYRSVDSDVLRGWPFGFAIGSMLVFGIARTHWKWRSKVSQAALLQ
jgi:hypothetical protein